MKNAAGEYEGLEERVAAVERSLEELASELRTRRLVVTDRLGAVRLVAEVVDEVMELRMDAVSTTRGRSGVLVFAVPSSAQLPAGFGLQLYSRGDAVRDLSYFEEA